MDSLGPYEIQAVLGRGAMGVVYRGFDPAIGRPVAIKVIQASEFATPDERAELNLRFAREATAVGKLSHPNIVAIYQRGEHEGLQFLVLELVSGGSLEQMLASGSLKTQETVLSILSQVADALDYAHTEGVVHRDVKPANILVRPDGKVKITDFGIARISAQTVTRTGYTMGTLGYMAPEQIMDAKVTGKADQFSLAVVAYRMLCGQMPFVADNDVALMFKIASEEPLPLHKHNGSYPALASEVLGKALAKEPERRYATCAEFVSHLSEKLQPPQPAPDTRVPERAPKVQVPTGGKRETISVASPLSNTGDRSERGVRRPNGQSFANRWLKLAAGLVMAGLVILAAITLIGILTYNSQENASPKTVSQTTKAEPYSSASVPDSSASIPDETNGGTITGKVAFDGVKPVAKALDMSAVPVCVRAHPTVPRADDVIVNDNGTLKNAFVWIKSGLPDKTWQVPTTAVMIDQDGCMYKPHVIGIMTGQNLDIKNSDPSNHNIHPQPTVNQEWSESQPPGSEDKIKTFARQEVMIPVKCNIHPWMRSYVGVMGHPFFAVTGDDGTFTIKGLPPGTYTVEVWHEKYGTQQQSVTVGAKEAKTQDFIIKG